MQAIVNQVFDIRYEGKAKMMFFRSQLASLLAPFFGQLSMMKEEGMPAEERQKLQQAKEILANTRPSAPVR